MATIQRSRKPVCNVLDCTPSPPLHKSSGICPSSRPLLSWNPAGYSTAFQLVSLLWTEKPARQVCPRPPSHPRLLQATSCFPLPSKPDFQARLQRPSQIGPASFSRLFSGHHPLHALSTLPVHTVGPLIQRQKKEKTWEEIRGCWSQTDLGSRSSSFTGWVWKFCLVM